MPVLRTGFEDDASDGDEGVMHVCRRDFLRPSDAVFPPAADGAFASAAQRDTVLRVSRRLGVPLVEPPPHIEEVCGCRCTTCCVSCCAGQRVDPVGCGAILIYSCSVRGQASLVFREASDYDTPILTVLLCHFGRL